MSVAIIDSGGANISSILYAFERLGVAVQLTTDRNIINSADRVILPGVGAAKDVMQRLRDHNLIDTIRSLKQPVLGICVGMQILVDASEEEDVECLGIIPGIAKKLDHSTNCPVPNMGWCQLEKQVTHSALEQIDNGSWFYFLHSYAVPVSDYTLASADHSQPFTAVIGKDNFVAAQFHPERSSQAGARFLRNFVETGL